jgi:opacity protein-like surface antigen
MKLKFVVSLLAFVSLFSVAAQAQEGGFHRIEVFAGYSYVRENPTFGNRSGFSLNGGSAELSYNVTNWLAGVADFGGYSSNNILSTHTNGTLSTYLFGPRVTYRHLGRIAPFGQALFGVAHTGTPILSTPNHRTVFSLATGIGVDFRLTSHWSLRPLEVDYLLTRFNEGLPATQSQNNLRASTGVVFRF